MTNRVLPFALILSLGFIFGALWTQHGPMATAQAQQGTTVVPLESGAVRNPVVACTALAYTTENEADAFETTRIVRTHTTVTSFLLTHADGSTEVSKAPGR